MIRQKERQALERFGWQRLAACLQTSWDTGVEPVFHVSWFDLDGSELTSAELGDIVGFDIVFDLFNEAQTLFPTADAFEHASMARMREAVETLAHAAHTRYMAERRARRLPTMETFRDFERLPVTFQQGYRDFAATFLERYQKALNVVYF